MPQIFRTRAGAEHSIAVRTGAPYREVRAFVDLWVAANLDILALVREAIAAEPYRNYFS